MGFSLPVLWFELSTMVITFYEQMKIKVLFVHVKVNK